MPGEIRVELDFREVLTWGKPNLLGMGAGIIVFAVSQLFSFLYIWQMMHRSVCIKCQYSSLGAQNDTVTPVLRQPTHILVSFCNL